MTMILDCLGKQTDSLPEHMKVVLHSNEEVRSLNMFILKFT